MSQPPTVYTDKFRRLADVFRAGYPSCPPLRHAVLTGVGCGVNYSMKDWTLLLRGEGHPWKAYPWPDTTREDEPWPSWRCCWLTDRDGPDLRGACKAFLDLAAEAARCRYGLLRPGPADPEGTTFLGEEWVAELHRLAWRVDDPVLKASRWRFHQCPEEPDTIIRVAYADVMATDPEQMSAPLLVGGRLIPANGSRAPLAFPHGFLSVLALDVFQTSVHAIGTLLADLEGRRVSASRVPPKSDAARPAEIPTVIVRADEVSTEPLLSKARAFLDSHRRYQTAVERVGPGGSDLVLSEWRTVESSARQLYASMQEAGFAEGTMELTMPKGAEQKGNGLLKLWSAARAVCREIPAGLIWSPETGWQVLREAEGRLCPAKGWPADQPFWLEEKPLLAIELAIEHLEGMSPVGQTDQLTVSSSPMPPGWFGESKPESVAELAEYLRTQRSLFVKFPARADVQPFYFREVKKTDNHGCKQVANEINPRYLDAHAGIGSFAIRQGLAWLHEAGTVGIPVINVTQGDVDAAGNGLSQLIAFVEALVEGETPDKDPIDKRPKSEFVEVLKVAHESMKGMERRIVELVCERGSKCPLVAMAADPQVQWSPPWDDAWNSARRRINKKIEEKTGWTLIRRDSAAILKRWPGRR